MGALDAEAGEWVSWTNVLACVIAWSERQADKMHGFLMSGMYARLRESIGLKWGEGKHMRMDGSSIRLYPCEGQNERVKQLVSYLGV